MALKRSERILIGLFLGVGAVAGIGILLIQPTWQSISETQTQLSSSEAVLKQTQETLASVKGELAQYQRSPHQRRHAVQIRSYTTDTREIVIKEMIDQLVNLATQTGNSFISLDPVEDKAPPQKKDVDKTNPNSQPVAPQATPGQLGDPSAANPEAAPANQLSVFQYDLAVRGGYDNVLQFLTSLKDHHELIEISSIDIKNEVGPERTSDKGGAAHPIDPSKPIKLTARLKLLLKPELAVGNP